MFNKLLRRFRAWRLLPVELIVREIIHNQNCLIFNWAFAISFVSAELILIVNRGSATAARGGAEEISKLENVTCSGHHEECESVEYRASRCRGGSRSSRYRSVPDAVALQSDTARLRLGDSERDAVTRRPTDDYVGSQRRRISVAAVELGVGCCRHAWTKPLFLLVCHYIT